MGDGLTFLSDPLENETEITGPSALKLAVSSSTNDADLFVVLQVFDPEGRRGHLPGRNRSPHADWSGVVEGIAQGSSMTQLSEPYRPYHTHDETQALTPGEAVDLDVEIWATSIVVPAGYRDRNQRQGQGL